MFAPDFRKEFSCCAAGMADVLEGRSSFQEISNEIRTGAPHPGMHGNRCSLPASNKLQELRSCSRAGGEQSGERHDGLVIKFDDRVRGQRHRQPRAVLLDRRPWLGIFAVHGGQITLLIGRIFDIQFSALPPISRPSSRA